MSENYSYPDFGAYNEEELGLPAKKTKKTSTKILKILLCTLCLVLLINGFIYFVIVPSTADCTVIFSGLETLDAEELGRTLALYCGTNWLGFDTAVAAAHIASNSSVESISVQKRFPNRIFIDIKERLPVAITLSTLDSKTVPILIDKNGVLFDVNTENLASSFPLITGLEFGTFVDGMRLDSRFYPLIQEISAIQKTNPAYFSLISEIRILPKEYDNYELAIYPIHLKTRVLLDRKLNEKSLELMMIALDVTNSINPGVPEVDLRYGPFSYKIE